MKKFSYLFLCACALLFGSLSALNAQNGNPKTMVTRADALFAQREYEQAAGYYIRLE